MMDNAKFFDAVRRGILGPKLSPGEVEGCTVILEAFDGFPLADVSYALGTAYHETASTMQPVKEYGGASYYFRMYDIKGARPDKARELGNLFSGDGVKYCGMGYPQVTGRKNYALAEKLFGIPFLADPGLMMDPKNAAKVMARFMRDGLFTGKKFADYLPRHGPATLDQFTYARPIINGRDCAAKVAHHAIDFQDAVTAGGWS